MAEQISGIENRLLDSADIDVVQWTLYTAVSWSGDPEIPSMEEVMKHPALAIYHQGWGRHGDIGVAASVDGTFAGAAVARLFTEEEHGHGYIDPETPELGIAVEPDFPCRGIGRYLMNALANTARVHGIHRLSLSVNNPNPAKHLYESLGYATVTDNGDSTLMVLKL
jgi:ribosomal protein S18 acetylase RimI-like enzyme